MGSPAEAGLPSHPAAADFATLPRDGELLFCLAILGDVAVRLRDRERAAALYRLLLPYARVNAMAAGEAPLGPVARYLGRLATTMSCLDDAAAHFEDAMEINARIGPRPLLAHTQSDYGRMLLARGRPGDEERGALLDEAVSTYRELGMDSWALAAGRQRNS
jgi:hypothetical protein